MPRPRLRDSFMEVARTTVDYAYKSRWLMHSKAIESTPNGHGSAVLVLPGFGGADWTTAVCRTMLSEKGYRPYEWENGINRGPNHNTVRHLKQRLDKINQAHGGKVDIIGHSLGGIFARELARQNPDKVARVITMGSPVGIGFYPKSGILGVEMLFQMLNPHAPLNGEPALAKNLIVPPKGVATTSIYTRNDGIVHWKSCLNPITDKSENIEVGTAWRPVAHCGLIANEAALAVMFDRLAQSTSKWRPFNPDEKPEIAALLRSKQAHEGAQLEKPYFDDEDWARIKASRPNLGFWPGPAVAA